MASFVVPSGHLEGSYDGVVLSTDLEPDDALAIKALAPRLLGVPLLVVVGEGGVDKRGMAVEMLQAFGLGAHATVAQGRRSAESWPAAVNACYRAAAARALAADGPGAAASPRVVEDGELAVAAELEGFLRRHAAPFALLLKPPHEVLGLPEELLRRTAATLYGSFNLVKFREALGATSGAAAESHAAKLAALEAQEAMLGSFRAMLFVERSASVGRDCQIDPGRAAGVWRAIDADAALRWRIPAAGPPRTRRATTLCNHPL